MPTPSHRSAREDPLAVADGWLQVVGARGGDPRREVDRSKPGLELVVFDMDGTLVHGSSWEILHEHFGVSNETNWQAYQRGTMDDLEFIRSDLALWLVEGRKVHVEDLVRVLDRSRIMDGAREVVEGLKARGIATCILSGGLDLLARRVCQELGIDMYVANGVRLDESLHLTGEGFAFVEIKDKGRTTRELLKKLGVPKERSASIGNSAYDVPMFRETGFGIAFNPSDGWVRRHARHVIEGTDMRPALSLFLSPPGTGGNPK